ncbi:exonuclease of the beta-lactamase fold involved in rna processing [Lasius niger]|uniref:Exonuclease of the beta-lactamase fold involved in rna processing n=1 Tax=Lasius niger TaxID=67767 RepID=A0A0J7KJY5_LASNI|nr:exonuclease of the beta-lactamase fold involved in rna processing [Lasius niger]
MNLSRFDTSLLLLPSRRKIGADADQDLIDKIEKVQEKIDRINSEIATKNASLQILDAATGTILENLVSEDRLESNRRVGRAQRRGGANRPRGGLT